MRKIMSKFKHLIFSLSLAIICLQLHASGGTAAPCLLKGQVTDAVTKKPVSGVVVSVSSSNGTPKEVMTDSEGYFYFKELPGCQVNLRFEKKGYVGYKYQAVSVKENTTVKINVQVSPEAESFPDDSEFPLLRMLDLK
jgi:Carboxypeptidase regulatory-like domain